MIIISETKFNINEILKQINTRHSLQGSVI